MPIKIKNYFFITLFLGALSACSLNHPAESTTTSPSQAGTVPATSTSTRPNHSGHTQSQDVENFYVINGRRYGVLKSSTGFRESGIASWYGDPFHGRKTSNGEIYDMHQLTAAHKHLPLPSYVEVTNHRNGKSVVVRVNDRGPFVGERVIDLSYAAAQALDVVTSGTTEVTIQGLDELNHAEDQKRIASVERPAFIQIASFSEQNNAHAYHQRLRQRGINNSRVFPTNTENGLYVYRIQIGPLMSGEDYDQSIQQLHQIGIKNTLLIRE